MPDTPDILKLIQKAYSDTDNPAVKSTLTQLVREGYPSLPPDILTQTPRINNIRNQITEELKQTILWMPKPLNQKYGLSVYQTEIVNRAVNQFIFDSNNYIPPKMTEKQVQTYLTDAVCKKAATVSNCIRHPDYTDAFLTSQHKHVQITLTCGPYTPVPCPVFLQDGPKNVSYELRQHINPLTHEIHQTLHSDGAYSRIPPIFYPKLTLHIKDETYGEVEYPVYAYSYLQKHPKVIDDNPFLYWINDTDNLYVKENPDDQTFYIYVEYNKTVVKLRAVNNLQQAITLMQIYQNTFDHQHNRINRLTNRNSSTCFQHLKLYHMVQTEGKTILSCIYTLDI